MSEHAAPSHAAASQARAGSDPLAVLTADERAVARLLGLGAGDAELARELGLAPIEVAALVEQIGLRLLHGGGAIGAVAPVWASLHPSFRTSAEATVS